MNDFTSAMSEGFRFLSSFEVFGVPVIYLLVGGVILSMVGRYIRGKK